MNKIEKIIAARGEVIQAKPAPQYNIILHNHNIIRALGDYDRLVYEEDFRLFSPKVGLDELAFVNILWYSLSDYTEYFTHNFTYETFKHTWWIARHIWAQLLAGSDKLITPTPFLGKQVGLKKSNPCYRAFMYFRDTDTVCHPLIEYQKGGNWRVNRLEDIVQEAQLLKMKWTVGSINEENWLD